MPGAIGIGEVLKDRYRLERLLGHGGMAAVWLGHDEVLDRPVAVKVLSDTIASDPDFVARFRREAQTVAGLSHPNLVGIYDFSEEGERPYLVMQFVPGENLAERLDGGSNVDCDQLARELLAALDHIHSARVLHRDIKPANVIVEPSGTTKLIDFGIAQPRDATALTKTGLILGTERYAAPEIMRGEAATERSDLYSCGVVLQSCWDGRSRSLGWLIGWLTEPDPHARPASARQAAAGLQKPALPTEPLTRAPEPTVGQPGRALSDSTVTLNRKASGGDRRTILAALLGLVALAVVAVAAFGGSGDDGSEEARPVTQAQDQRAETRSAPEPEVSARATEPAASEPAEETAPVPDPSGADPDIGGSLNEEGFALIEAGEYEAAVPILEEAVARFPEGTDDLDYAYALFNLGHALRLSGRAKEAVPILERRLQIPNQKGEVRKELEAALAEADL